MGGIFGEFVRWLLCLILIYLFFIVYDLVNLLLLRLLYIENDKKYF
jgi:hypothetical protein